MYICMLVYNIALLLGMLIWWLNFDILSSVAMGGIASSIIPALLGIFYVGHLLCKLCKKDSIKEDHEMAAILLVSTMFVSTFIGMMLTVGIIAIFPNTVIGFTLISAIIGTIATIAGFFIAAAIVGAGEAVIATNIEPTYVGIPQEERVDECITFPEEEVNESITYPKIEEVSSTKETAV